MYGTSENKKNNTKLQTIFIQRLLYHYITKNTRTDKRKITKIILQNIPEFDNSKTFLLIFSKVFCRHYPKLSL